jgi:hypothetical protein
MARELNPLEQAMLTVDWIRWMETAIQELRRVKAHFVEQLSEDQEKGEDWMTCVDLLELLEELTTVTHWDLSLHSCSVAMMKKILKDLERLDEVNDTLIADLQAFLAQAFGWMPPDFP